MPSTRNEKALVWLTLAASTASIASVHGPLIGYKTYANVDEAYAMGIAERLLEGHKLYEGAVSQRGPLMYYAFEGIAWLHGWDNVMAFRAWALAFALAHLYLVWLVGRVFLSTRAALIATSLTGYALTFGFPAYDGYALHGEALQLPALVLAALGGALAMKRAPKTRARSGLLVLSGVLFGVAASIKQSVLVHPIALVLWIAIDNHRRRARGTLAETAVLAASCALVPALFVLHAWREGTLTSLYYYTVTYNREVHLRPTTRSLAWLPNVFFRLLEQTGFFVLVAGLASNALPNVWGRLSSALRSRSGWAALRGFGPTSYFALHAAIALASASTMWRFFPHYFLQAWPFVALWAGGVVDRWTRGRRRRVHLSRLVVAFSLLVVLCGVFGTVIGERIDGRVAHDRTVQDIAKYVEATTRPEDKVFVWGFSPWVYNYAHRRPAGRYMFETYVTGMVPWFWEKLSVEHARVVPGSVAALLSDLDREKPEVVVDAGSIMLGRPIRTYQEFSDWLHASYCFVLRLGAFDVYHRKPTPDAACDSPYFPRPHPIVDWNGHGMAIPIPRVVDQDLTRLLPVGNYFKPIWFEDQPKPPHLEALRDAKREKEEAEAAADGFAIEGD